MSQENSVSENSVSGKLGVRKTRCQGKLGVRSPCAPCKVEDLQRVRFPPGNWVAPKNSVSKNSVSQKTRCHKNSVSKKNSVSQKIRCQIIFSKNSVSKKTRCQIILSKTGLGFTFSVVAPSVAVPDGDSTASLSPRTTRWTQTAGRCAASAGRLPVRRRLSAHLRSPPPPPLRLGPAELLPFGEAAQSRIVLPRPVTPIAGPAVIGRITDHPRSQGIHLDVAQDPEPVPIVLDHRTLESPLPDVA